MTINFSFVDGPEAVQRDNTVLMAGADPGFGQGGAPASEAESCRHSEAESRERSEQSAARVQGP